MPKGIFIKKRTRTVKGVRITTNETDIASKYNTLSVEAGTTGYCGGNEKSGSRTYVRICDIANSNIEVERDGNGKGFVIRASGDCELSTLIDALTFCSEQLKKQCAIKENIKGVSHDDDITTPNVLATDKQLKYLISLMEETDFRLVSERITQKEASELINFFKGERKAFPPCAVNVLKRKSRV